MTLLPEAEKKRLYTLAKNNPALAFLHALESLQKSAKSMIEREIERQKPDYEKLTEDLRGEDGVDAEAEDVAQILLDTPGFMDELRPDDGYTPTKEHLCELFEEYLVPLIPTMPTVIHGKSPTKKELRSLIRDLIPEPIAGKSPTKTEVKALIKEIFPKLKELGGLEIAKRLNKHEEIIDQKTIKGLKKAFENIQTTFRETTRRKKEKMNHGGGHTLKAGAGQTLIRNSDGTITLSFSTGGAILEATGTVNDSNVTFTFTQLPTLIFINGAGYRQTGGAITWSWVASTLTATLSSPVGTGGSIFGQT